MTLRVLGVPALLAVLAATGCPGIGEVGIAPGDRLVTGRLELAGGASVPRQRRAMQLVALFAAPECQPVGVRIGDASPEGDLAACAIFGEPFDPGELGGGVDSEPFRLRLPCDLTVNLLVQAIGGGGAAAPGAPVALLAFPTGNAADETTTLLARDPQCRDTPKLATNVLDLGAIRIPPAPAVDGPPRVVVGGPEGGENPLATIDTDQDLAANVADADDDGDDVPDVSDEDADGDGAADVAQTFTDDWL